ncbi:MAG: hypothetical protein ACOC4C_04940 [Fibrobacterota bacterium]
MTEKTVTEPPYENLITISQAARLRNVTRQTMSTLVKRKRFTVYEGVGRALLDRREVESYQPSRGGRPRKPVRKRGRRK